MKYSRGTNDPSWVASVLDGDPVLVSFTSLSE